METSDTTATTLSSSSSRSNSRSPSPPSPTSPLVAAAAAAAPPPPQVVVSPCAACKILRRRCGEKCVLAPYFPPTDPIKFTTAHRVFGASNIIKFLQELPESQRADAVSSMVYEANARLRDPVYGCAGAICQLQKQVSELQAQLAKAQAELLNMQCHQTNLVAFLLEMAQSPQSSPSQQSADNNFAAIPQFFHNNPSLLDEINLGSLWEPLWT
ncbi:hypothetical protein NMG60_11033874 [Bertholletia excelsa]